jgi:hypothetical protein
LHQIAQKKYIAVLCYFLADMFLVLGGGALLNALQNLSEVKQGGFIFHA